MNIAIILAGGSGNRFGADKPKQFVNVAGKTIMEHTLDAFTINKYIDEIAIVSHADYIEEVRSIVSNGGYTKVRNILCGGKERYHSSLAALKAYSNDEDNLLIHDCVRPLVSQRIINECVEALEKYEVVDVAVNATDTIIEINNDGRIVRMPERKMLRCTQTPQGFRRGTLAKAFELALRDESFLPTDDCGIVFRYLPEVDIHIIDGDAENIKVTYPADILRVESKKHPPLQ